MSNTGSSLPIWLVYVQALGPPFVAFVFGAVAAMIAWRQWKTANDKLRLDLFDRRWKVFDAVKLMVNKSAIHGDFTIEDLRDFSKGIRGF